MKKESLAKVFVLSLVASSALYGVDSASLQSLINFSSNSGWFIPNFQEINDHKPIGAFNSSLSYVPNTIKDMPDFSAIGLDKNNNKAFGLYKVFTNNTFNSTAQTLLAIDGKNWGGFVDSSGNVIADPGKEYFNSEIKFGDRTYYVTDAWNGEGIREFVSNTNGPVALRLNKYVTEVKAMELLDGWYSQDSDGKFSGIKNPNATFFKVASDSSGNVIASKINSSALSVDSNNRLVIDKVMGANGEFYNSSLTDLNQPSSSALLMYDPSTKKTSIVGILSSDDGVNEHYIFGNELQKISHMTPQAGEVTDTSAIKTVTAMSLSGNYDISRNTTGLPDNDPEDAKFTIGSDTITYDGTYKYKFFLSNGSTKTGFFGYQGQQADVDTSDPDYTAHKGELPTNLRYALGQSLALSADADTTINLKDDLIQGSGGLVFTKGKFKLTTDKDAPKIYVGAGFDIAKDAEVTINGVGGYSDNTDDTLYTDTLKDISKNDYLHKIGEGKLIIDDKGFETSAVSRSNLSIGDGEVRLQYLSEGVAGKKNGKFDKIELVSGNGILTYNNYNNAFSLTSANSIDGGLEFGYRGGVLKASSNISFDHIRAADEGARIYNDTNSIKNLSITPYNGGGSIFDNDIISHNNTLIYHGYIGKGFNITVDGSAAPDSISDLKYVFDGGIGVSPYYDALVDDNHKDKYNGDKGEITIKGGIEMVMQGSPYLNNGYDGFSEAWKLGHFDTKNITIEGKNTSLSIGRDARVTSDDGIVVKGSNNVINFGNNGKFVYIDTEKGIKQDVSNISSGTPDTNILNFDDFFKEIDANIKNIQDNGLANYPTADSNTLPINASGNFAASHWASYKGKVIDTTEAKNTEINMGDAYVTTAIAGNDTTVLDKGSHSIWFMSDNSKFGKFNNGGMTYFGSTFGDNSIGKTLEVDDYVGVRGSINGSSVPTTSFNPLILMNVDPSGKGTDLLKINNSAIGATTDVYLNALNLVSSGDNAVSKPDKVVFIEAPEDTSKDAFKVPAIETESAAFHKYVPNKNVHLGEVVDGKRLWYFQKDKIEIPWIDLQPSTPIEKPQEPAKEPSVAPQEPAEKPEEPVIVPVEKNPFYDAVVDNTYAKRVRGLLGVSEAIFMYEDELLMKRLGDIRSAKLNGGFWFKEKMEGDKILDANLRLNEVEFGVDKKDGDNFYGLLGAFGNGHADVSGGKNEFKYFAVGGYYTYAPVDGWFVDVVGKYIYSNQKINLPGKASFSPFSKTTNADVNMFLGSIQTGYRFLQDDGWFVEPSGKITAGWIEGFKVKGKLADAKVDDAAPVFYKVGFQTGKYYDISGTNMTTSVGIHYEDKFDRDEGKIHLEDTIDKESYKTFDTGRFVTNISTDAHFTDNLTIYGRAETSFDGDFKTKFGGQIGLRYNF